MGVLCSAYKSGQATSKNKRGEAEASPVVVLRTNCLKRQVDINHFAAAAGGDLGSRSRFVGTGSGNGSWAA